MNMDEGITEPCGVALYSEWQRRSPGHVVSTMRQFLLLTFLNQCSLEGVNLVTAVSVLQHNMATFYLERHHLSVLYLVQRAALGVHLCPVSLLSEAARTSPNP